MIAPYVLKASLVSFAVFGLLGRRCQSRPVLEESNYFLGGHQISAVFNDSNGNAAYNITLPANTCGTAVVGDFDSPSGQTIPNATVRDIIIQLRANYRQHGFLRDYTIRRARALQSEIRDLLSQVISEPADHGDWSSRELLSSALSLGQGLWTALLVYSPIGGGVAWMGLYLAISAANEKKITVLEESAAIAALGLFEATLLTVLLHLDRQQMFGPFELFIVNVFVTAGMAMKRRAQGAWSGTCFRSQEVANWVDRLKAGFFNGLPVFPTTMSTTNLVNMGEQSC